eukprot:TRINITY_DN66392_c9_g1_i12.p1 TRINITY_DN66392_c9_g1~~TRINITY_DN66392_c9_g1_i12.p1  ORF type:complete len:190 (+),score=101.51 TRINITY_DN66392_c9_g1_i12:98-667(+)
MGNFFAKVWDKFSGVKDCRIVMIGLDAAGKTTILYKFKIGETLTTMPTIGFNCETLSYKNVNMTMWDVGGQDKIRPLWRHYYRDCDGIIFVIDAADQERMTDGENSAAEELWNALNNDELRDAALLVYANKQDLPGALSVDQMAKAMQLNKLRHRPWYVQASNARTGEGLYEGLDWLAETVKKRAKAKQ